MMYKDEDWLYNEYIVLQKSTAQVGRDCDASAGTILKWLVKYNIPTRSVVEGVNIIWKDKKYRNRDWLYEQYIVLRKSSHQIAKENDFEKSSVLKWLKKFGIDRRTKSEALMGKKLSPEHRLKCIANAKFFPSGPEHPNWVDGKSCVYPSEFNEELKRTVRERDGYVCQYCGKTQEEVGYTLPVHHIDYDKKNNDINNLVTLCCSCHCKTNYNRDKWIGYFRNRKKDDESGQEVCMS